MGSILWTRKNSLHGNVYWKRILVGHALIMSDKWSMFCA